MADTGATNPRKLLILEIATPTLVWNRAIVTTYLPPVEDLEFYYGTILGFEKVKITLRTQDIPTDFNESLLNVIERAPSQFPVNDLETETEETDRRDKYHGFINQLCDMERSRVSLRMFVRTPDLDAPAVSQFRSSRQVQREAYRLKRRAWVKELLQSIGADEPENTTDELEGAIREGAIETHPPVGWIFTPVESNFRNTRGSKIVLNEEIGRKWEQLLGTDIYPDCVVSRRISTVTWAFQHTTSDTLVKATIDWYLAAQDANMKNGMSGWILDADAEIASLFYTFKRVKVNERLILENLPKSSDKHSQMYKLLTMIESQCLASSLEDPEVRAVGGDLLTRYVNYCCRAHQIPKEIYNGSEAVNQYIVRWTRGSFGFRKNAPPVVESWGPLWTALMSGGVNPDSMNLFLKSLDSWDPVESMTYSLAQRGAVVGLWVGVFFRNEMITEEKGQVRTIELYDKMKEYMCKFLNPTTLGAQMVPSIMGPHLTRLGLNAMKKSGGRVVVGWRLREIPIEVRAPVDKNVDPEIEVVSAAAAAAAAAATATATATVRTKDHATGSERIDNYFSSTSATIAGTGQRVENVFVAATTHEIHLGTL